MLERQGLGRTRHTGIRQFIHRFASLRLPNEAEAYLPAREAFELVDRCATV
jgi:hypothetical protein